MPATRWTLYIASSSAGGGIARLPSLRFFRSVLEMLRFGRGELGVSSSSSEVEAGSSVVGSARMSYRSSALRKPSGRFGSIMHRSRSERSVSSPYAVLPKGRRWYWKSCRYSRRRPLSFLRRAYIMSCRCFATAGDERCRCSPSFSSAPHHRRATHSVQLIYRSLKMPSSTLPSLL